MNHSPTYVREPTSCHQEIDVVEQYAGGSPPDLHSTVAGAIHTTTGSLQPGEGGSSSDCKASCCDPQEYVRTSVDYSSRWTNFTVDWTPDYVTIAIDGTTVENFNRTDVVAQFTDELFLAITACVMNRMPPGPGDVLPQEYEIDSVQVWELMNTTAVGTGEERGI